MSIFDSLKTLGADQPDHADHAAIHMALESSPLGGVAGLLGALHEGGLHDAVHSWTEGSDHATVSADQLKDVLDDDHVQHVASALGVSTDEVYSGLAAHLPALAAAHAADSEASEDDHDDAEMHEADEEGHDPAEHHQMADHDPEDEDEETEDDSIEEPTEA